ncbi:Smim19 [Columba livia]|nr:Smim19 [Columba livia]
MAAAAGGAGGDSGAIDYSVHEAWNEATNVYLLVVLASLALLVYARRNKRRIMRIFTLPPAAETPPEPNFYDSMKKIRLRQQLEMYSIALVNPAMRKANPTLPDPSNRGTVKPVPEKCAVGQLNGAYETRGFFTLIGI